MVTDARPTFRKELEPTVRLAQHPNTGHASSHQDSARLLRNRPSNGRGVLDGKRIMLREEGSDSLDATYHILGTTYRSIGSSMREKSPPATDPPISSSVFR